jgi:hypothetical protein
MKAYADIGVQVQITEFDIRARPSASDWNKAAIVASDVLKACVNSPNCTAFNNWGFTQAIYPNGLDGKVLVMLPWDDEGRVTPGVLQQCELYLRAATIDRLSSSSMTNGLDDADKEDANKQGAGKIRSIRRHKTQNELTERLGIVCQPLQNHQAVPVGAR